MRKGQAACVILILTAPLKKVLSSEHIRGKWQTVDCLGYHRNFTIYLITTTKIYPWAYWPGREKTEVNEILSADYGTT